MKILLAPSETKASGGDYPPFNEASFLFPELYAERQEALQHYQNLLDHGNFEALKALFGIKTEAQIAAYKNQLTALPTMKAICRYTGVAFDYLDYPSLSKEAQTWIDHNVLLFSNLFGPLLAGDQIPEYKFKQGAKLPHFKIEQHYKQHFQTPLDDWIGEALLIDLRAGFYEKFYKPSIPSITIKFLKNGKVVSHWAKAYRGVMTRELALDPVESEEALCDKHFTGLKLHQKTHKGPLTLLTYHVLD